MATCRCRQCREVCDFERVLAKAEREGHDVDPDELPDPCGDCSGCAARKAAPGERYVYDFGN
jgi:heterodisulfide reductase subunit A-like polyferredoxin